MRKQILFLTFLFYTALSLSQSNSKEILFNEINQQILISNFFYPTELRNIDKRFNFLHGSVKSEVIIYPDSIKRAYSYKKDGNLTELKSFKNSNLKSSTTFEYDNANQLPIKERGVNSLDFTVLEKTQNRYKYFAVNTPKIKQTGLYRYLDTLFITATKNTFEYIRQSHSKYSAISEYRYNYEFNKYGNIIKVYNYENDIKAGHLKNEYNEKNQVIISELFWDYDWFVEDTGIKAIRNKISYLTYREGLISSVKTKSYNSETMSWELETLNYDCNLSFNNDIAIVDCNCDDGNSIKLKIDQNYNWISRLVTKQGVRELTTRLIEYYN